MKSSSARDDAWCAPEVRRRPRRGLSISLRRAPPGCWPAGHLYGFDAALRPPSPEAIALIRDGLAREARALCELDTARRDVALGTRYGRVRDGASWWSIATALIPAVAGRAPAETYRLRHQLSIRLRQRQSAGRRSRRPRRHDLLLTPTAQDAERPVQADDGPVRKTTKAAVQRSKPKRDLAVGLTRDVADDDAWSAVTALDELRGRIATVEALICSADSLVDAVPHVTDRERRRRLGHLVEMIVAAAKAARDAVDLGEQLAVEVMRRRKTSRS